MLFSLLHWAVVFAILKKFQVGREKQTFTAGNKAEWKEELQYTFVTQHTLICNNNDVVDEETF